MLHYIFQSQLSGKRPSRISSLPQEAYSRLGNFSPHGIAGICFQLEKFNYILDCKLLVDELVRLFNETHGEEKMTIMNHLVLCGGENHLIRILSVIAEALDYKRKSRPKMFLLFWTKFCFGRLPDDDLSRTERLESYLSHLEHILCELARDCLLILKEICVMIPYYSETLAQHPNLLLDLFLLMSYKPLFDHAVGLVDEILSVREEVLTLKDIPNLRKIFSNASNHQLALLCRILAMAVFEQEESLNEEFNLPSKKTNSNFTFPSLLEMEDTSSVTNENQQFLLGIEGFLPRLVNLLKMSIARESATPQSRQTGHVLEENLFDAFRRDTNDSSADGNRYREYLFGDAEPNSLGDERNDQSNGNESEPVIHRVEQVHDTPVNPIDRNQTNGTNFAEFSNQDRLRSEGEFFLSRRNELGDQDDTSVRADSTWSRLDHASMSAGQSLSDSLTFPSGRETTTLSGLGSSPYGYDFFQVNDSDDEEIEGRNNEIVSENRVGFWQSFLRWRSGNSRESGSIGSSNSVSSNTGNSMRSTRNNTQSNRTTTETLASTFTGAIGPSTIFSSSTTSSSSPSSSVMNAISFLGNLNLFRGRNDSMNERNNQDRNDRYSSEPNRIQSETERSQSAIANEIRTTVEAMNRVFELRNDENERPLLASPFPDVHDTFSLTTSSLPSTSMDNNQNSRAENLVSDYSHLRNAIRHEDEEDEEYLETHEELPNDAPLERPSDARLHDSGANINGDYDNGDDYVNTQSETRDQLQNENENRYTQDERRRDELQNARERIRQEFEEGMEDLRRTIEQRNHDLCMIAMTSHLVEVLFVMCSLCGGSSKEDVQNKLHNLGLLNVLNNMFDLLDWFSPPPVSLPESHGIHGPGCSCNPKSALRVQYLRLVHNFFDRDSQKMIYYNKIKLKGLPSWSGNVGDRIRASVRLVRPENNLVLKIIDVLTKLSEDSPYRFWLASSIEAFLRGSDPRDQLFIARTGIMRHLLESIVKEGFRCSSSLQISFDLLGEIIKFNPSLFSKFDDYFLEEQKNDKFKRFIEVMVSHLVDSNVFIRSVIISLEYFRVGHPSPPHAVSSSIPPLTRSSPSQASPSSFSPSPSVLGLSSATPSSSASPPMSHLSTIKYEGYTFPTPYSHNKELEAALPLDHNCKIADFMRQNSVRLLYDLMKTVKPSDVNQDNICVLNTALVFFIFAERRKNLIPLLKALRTLDGLETISPFFSISDPVSENVEDPCLSSPSTPGKVLHNFRSLLDLWRQHYAKKRRGDCANLQYSTNVPFEEWVKVVNLLCLDPDQLTSLSYIPHVNLKLSCGSVSSLEDVPPARHC